MTTAELALKLLERVLAWEEADEDNGMSIARDILLRTGRDFAISATIDGSAWRLALADHLEKLCGGNRRKARARSGGLARAQKLGKQRCSDIAKIAATRRWDKSAGRKAKP